MRSTNGAFLCPSLRYLPIEMCTKKKHSLFPVILIPSPNITITGAGIR